MWIPSDDDTNSTEELRSEYDSKDHSDVEFRMANGLDEPYGVDLDGDEDMERDGGNEEEELEEEEHAEEEDEEEEDEEEEEEEDEDEGKEPHMIGQGEMVNTLADDADTMVDDQPIMLPGHGQEMGDHTPQPQPPSPAPWPQTPEPHPQPWTPETHPVGGLEVLGLVTTQ